MWLRPLAGAAAEPAGTDGSGFLKIPAEVGEAAATVNADVVVLEIKKSLTPPPHGETASQRMWRLVVQWYKHRSDFQPSESPADLQP